MAEFFNNLLTGLAAIAKMVYMSGGMLLVLCAVVLVTFTAGAYLQRRAGRFSPQAVPRKFSSVRRLPRTPRSADDGLDPASSDRARDLLAGGPVRPFFMDSISMDWPVPARRSIK